MAPPFYAEKLPVQLVCYFLVFICILVLLKRVVDYKRYRFNETGTEWIGINVLLIRMTEWIGINVLLMRMNDLLAVS